MMRATLSRVAAIRAACAVLALLFAMQVAGGAGEVSRRVLGLYNARTVDHNEPTFSDVQEFLAMSLNHLGFVVDYHDLNQPLPDFKPYRGIIVWPNSYEFDQAEKFFPWILAAMDAGVKIIFPSGIYAPNLPGGPGVGYEEMGQIMDRFGLEPANVGAFENFSSVKTRVLRPEYLSFETPMTREFMPDDLYRAKENGGADVWIRIEHGSNPDVNAVVVASSPAGFWCMNSDWLIYQVNVPGAIYRVAWNANPFAVLEIGLDSAALPKPDVTTFWGTRGAYAHSDVDGPSNMSWADVPGPSRMALKVIIDEVWRKYPFPVTAGLISAEYDPDIDLRFIMPNETPEQTLARPRLAWEKPQKEIAMALRELVNEMATLPNIQFGCHAYSHPLDWRNMGLGYVIRDYTPTYETEIRGGVDYLNEHVLPPGRKVELYQWSGDCDPPSAALDILADMGMANINGGDPRYDARHNSIYFICPLSEPKGKHLQILTSGANENIYTDGWNGFKGAYNNVTSTFERSDAPRRLLPVNIYYHAFPAERLAGYVAIQNAYEWASRQRLCWMTALEYVKAAESFFKVRIGSIDGGGWWVEDYGTCPTVRFDRETRRIDMRRSKNVAGYSYHNGSLYVALIPGERAEIHLVNGKPESPALAGSSGMVRHIERGDRYWQAEVRVWGPGFIDLWAPEGDWKASAEYPGGKKSDGQVKRLSDGRLQIAFADAAGQWVRVRFEN